MRLVSIILLVLLTLTGCGKKNEVVAAPQLTASAPKPVQAPVVVQRTNGAGLVVGVRPNAQISGVVYMGGAPVNRAEITVASYDLATHTSGVPLGIAVADAKGEFTVSYSTNSTPTFIKLEARLVDYVGPSDQQVRRVSLLASIINGMPADPARRFAISPVTNLVFFRFRHLARGGVDPTVAFDGALSETMSKSIGTGWGLPQSPLLTPATTDEAQAAFMAAWDESIRFDRVLADDYFRALAQDYEDGVFDGVDGGGKEIIIANERGKPSAIAKSYFTAGAAAGFQRFQLCRNTELSRAHLARVEAKCL